MANREVLLMDDTYVKVSADNATTVDLKVPRLGFGASELDAIAFLKGDPNGLPVREFTATPVPTISGGSGSGATITSITVNASGQITDVVIDDGGSNYAEGDIIIFTQAKTGDDYTVPYTLLTADVSSGEIQNLSGKTLAPINSVKDHDRLAAVIDGAKGETNALLGIDVTNTALWCRWAGISSIPASDKYAIVHP